MTDADAVRVRPALPHEHATLEALQRRASLANPGDRAALLEHPDAIAIPAGQIARGDVFVAESPRGVLGFAALLAREDGDTELDGLFVSPEHWGHGVGRRLVEFCAAVARARGSAWLHVVANDHAGGFYTRCGFEQVGVVATRFAPAPAMRRKL